MTNPRNIVAAVGLAVLFAGTSARADVVTWELTGTVTSLRGAIGFAPPTYFNLGDTVTIDYTIDLSTPFQTINQAQDIETAIQSATFDGQATDSAELNWTNGFLQAINQNFSFFDSSQNLYYSTRNDGVTFVSFNYYDPPPVSDVQEALNDIQSAVSIPSATSLRFDFQALTDPGSVFVTPTSFEIVTQFNGGGNTPTIPEPSSISLFATAVVSMVAGARRFRKQYFIRKNAAVLRRLTRMYR